MMNLQQHLLIKLAEECTEVGKVALKATIFGGSDHSPLDPNKTTNLQKLYEELDDLQASIELLNDTGFGYTPNPRNILNKKVKVIRYMEHSIVNGMTDESASYEYDACKDPNI
jgi:hypothetical protein